MTYILVKSDKSAIKYTKVTYFLLWFCLGFLISIPFAVDSYMAVFGFVKFLPLIPLSIIFSRLEKSERETVLKLTPDIGVFLILISYAFVLYQPVYSFFSVNGRISGMFQYPNTFALFLLVGIILVVTQLSNLKLSDKKKSL